MLVWCVGWLAIGASLGVLMLEHPARREGHETRPLEWIACWAILWPLIAIRIAWESLVAWRRDRLR